jgi:hypothetical protein
MLHMTLLAEAIQADREREFRNRRPRVPGVPTGLRHPRQELERAVAALDQRPATTSLGKPAMAGSR